MVCHIIMLQPLDLASRKPGNDHVGAYPMIPRFESQYPQSGFLQAYPALSDPLINQIRPDGTLSCDLRADTFVSWLRPDHSMFITDES